MNPQLEALRGTIMKLNVEDEKEDIPSPLISEDIASPHHSSSTMFV